MSPSGRFNHRPLYWTVWDRFMQVLYLGRAPRTKETLPDFLKWRRVTRHPLVFRGLTGSQRTPGFGASHIQMIMGKHLRCRVYTDGRSSFEATIVKKANMWL